MGSSDCRWTPCKPAAAPSHACPPGHLRPAGGCPVAGAAGIAHGNRADVGGAALVVVADQLQVIHVRPIALAIIRRHVPAIMVGKRFGGVAVDVLSDDDLAGKTAGPVE